MRASTAVTLLGLIVGCASTSARPEFDEVATLVEDRSGHRVQWRNDDAAANAEIEHTIDTLLQSSLTADTAVRLALLCSPSLQAELEELAIARADLVQAGLLKNPVLGFGRTSWESEHISPNLFATIEQDFLDVVTMPMRKRVAANELEAAKLQIGDAVLELAAQVRAAYYEAQAAEQVLAMRRLVEKAAIASGDLAKQQHSAGNINDLSLNTELALQAATTVERKHAETHAAMAREVLNKHVGLWGARTAWQLPRKLPELPEHEPSFDALETRAIAQRLDVGVARRNVQGLRYALTLAQTTRWTGIVNVSVEVGRLRTNKRLSFGPSVTLEIPLFDQRRAQIAKLEAFTRQAEDKLHALSVDVRADVRSAIARVQTTRAIVEDYGRVVVPLRENVVRAAQTQYNAMLLGVYRLIQAKQSEYDAYREYIEALRDYWIARSDLERAVGSRIDIEEEHS